MSVDTAILTILFALVSLAAFALSPVGRSSFALRWIVEDPGRSRTFTVTVVILGLIVVVVVSAAAVVAAEQSLRGELLRRGR